MPRTILLASFLQLSLFGLGQQVKVTHKGPYAEMDKMIHDYGTIAKGADGICHFTVTNTGDAPLVISDCLSNCGCTVPVCPKEAIAPGAKARVKVEYDTQRVGRINRSVTMMTNATNARQLQVLIKGEVTEGSAAPVVPK